MSLYNSVFTLLCEIQDYRQTKMVEHGIVIEKVTFEGVFILQVVRQKTDLLKGFGNAVRSSQLDRLQRAI